MTVPGAGTCMVPGCENKSARGQLMCRTCWYRVTPETRGEVNRTWRRFQAGHVGLEALRKVQMRAVQEAEA